jgi:hypothetical protein
LKVFSLYAHYRYVHFFAFTGFIILKFWRIKTLNKVIKMMYSHCTKAGPPKFLKCIVTFCTIQPFKTARFVRTWLKWFQNKMVFRTGLKHWKTSLEIEWQLKTRPSKVWTTLDNLKTELIRYLDGHCSPMVTCYIRLNKSLNGSS